LGTLSDDEDINRAWENIKGIIKTSAEDSIHLYEQKQHTPWFDGEYLGFFLDKRQQAKMQWIQDKNQNNVDNLNNARCEASRHFRNKKKEYRKAKIDEFWAG